MAVKPAVRGAAPTDPHPTALGAQGGASLASCTIPPFADGPHHPQNKVPSNGPAGKPFILSLRNDKAASTKRGLAVLISAHKRKKKKLLLMPKEVSQVLY